MSKELPRIPSTRLVGHEGAIHDVIFSSDGNYCLTAGHDRTVRLWNPNRLDPAQIEKIPCAYEMPAKIRDVPQALPISVYRDGHTHPIASVAIDQGSTTILSASEKTLVVTDVITQALKRRLHGHEGRINSVVSTSCPSIYASGSYDGTVRIWDGRSTNPSPVQTLTQAKDSVSSIQILEDDEVSLVAASVDGVVRTYDIRMGRLVFDEFGDEAVTCVAITKDKLLAAVSCLGGNIHVVERSSGRILETLRGGRSTGRYALRCVFNATDKYICSGSENGDAVFYNINSGKTVQTLSGFHTLTTSAIACHPLRDFMSVVITGSYDGNALVWTNGNPTYCRVD